MQAERRVQHSFSKMPLVQGLTLLAMILLFAAWRAGAPDRREAGWRNALVRFEPVALDPRGFGELRLAGAWAVTSDDPRFGGISALAMASGEFVALSDSGVVIRFPKPGRGAVRAAIGELPGGPGAPGFKANRDSEALVRDPLGRGWWVAFESRNELWLYGEDFRHSLRRVRFDKKRWPRNRGIEGIAAAGDALLSLPESGAGLVEVRGSSTRVAPILKPAGRISDAARLPSGELLVVNRRLTLRGFANSIATLGPSGNGYRYGRRVSLPLGMLDNVEALAPERLPGGGVRLWLMTDDGYQRPFRTLLLALDLPAKPPQARPRPS